MLHPSLRGRAATAGLIAIVLAIGCRGEAPATHEAQPAAAGTAHRMTIVGLDFAFQAPDTVPAGLTTITFINRGPDFHHATLVRLDEGKTMADLQQVLTQPAPPPAWAVMVGGPNVPAPGDTTNATLVLTPGHYAIVCVIPTGGMPHFMKGMLRALTVVPDPDAATDLPATDVTVSLTDYDFTFSQPLTAGSHRVLVRNDAAQWHEIVIFRLEPSKTLADLFGWLETPEGPPPGMPMGGTTSLSPGQADIVDLTVTPGEYALMCFDPDVTDGKPHFMHGMVKQITVS